MKIHNLRIEIQNPFSAIPYKSNYGENDNGKSSHKEIHDRSIILNEDFN